MRRAKSLIRPLLSARKLIITQAQTLKMTSVDDARESAEERYRDKHLPQVLHVSENFLCVDKGYDIKINCDDPTEMTLEHQVRKLHPELVDPSVAHSFRFVHRLDYATSGIICLGLHKQAAKVLSHQFKHKRVIKYYLALVRGHVQEDLTYVDVATGDLEDEEWPGRRCIHTHPACINVKPTETFIVRLETGSFDGEPATKILLKPITGKQHQLRVHCDHIGHTIVGDYTYSLRQDTKPERMMLHAYRLLAKTKLETLDLVSSDPFTSSVLPEWTPEQVHRSYQEAENIAASFIPYKTENVNTVILECD